MNKEVRSIIHNLQNVLSGQPWYGRAVYGIIDEIDPAIVHTKPAGNSHSLIELLYHMITWAGFTLSRLDGDKKQDVTAFEKLDWREIDPKVHTWENGIREYREIHQRIMAILETKEDDFLRGIVDHREYNFRFLLNGLIQHNIYHAGQIAYVKKQLA
jgi:uncharacterized damage-inducible protein DinB